MKKMDIVACTDKWFVMPTGVMMYSVCVNNPDVEIVFYVIHDDSVTSEDQHDLEDVIKSFNNKSVCFYSFNDVYADAFPSGRDLNYITKTTYFRLFIDVLLPSNIEKVLYLDGDIIVRHSLLPLWEVDLGNHAIAAVIDGMEGDMEFYNRLKYPPHLGYFNAGVLLVNLKYWRDNTVIKDFRQYMENHSDSIVYHDQDILNVAFKEKKLELHIKYNMQHRFLHRIPLYNYRKYEQQVLEARRDPIIVHFTGPYKPWDKYQRTPHPFRSTFYKYQNQTKWKGVKCENRPFKMRLINYVADTLRRLRIMPRSTMFDYIDIAPID